jgi:hypothetical protein
MPQAEKTLSTRDAAKPLTGRRIIVTRARSQAGALAERVEELGGEVSSFLPSIFSRQKISTFSMPPLLISIPMIG